MLASRLPTREPPRAPSPTGDCFEAVYTTAKKNQATQLNAKSDLVGPCSRTRLRRVTRIPGLENSQPVARGSRHGWIVVAGERGEILSDIPAAYVRQDGEDERKIPPLGYRFPEERFGTRPCLHQDHAGKSSTVFVRRGKGIDELPSERR
jgi:hypothetical protein